VRTDGVQRSIVPPPPRRRAVRASDIGVLGGIPVLLVLAWCVPERFWGRIARLLAPLSISTFTSNRALTEATIARTLGRRGGTIAANRILPGIAAERTIAVLQILRCYRPFRRDPRVRLHGLDRVERARQAGRGVMLWVSHGIHGDLGAKAAFRAGGLAVGHLSTPAHGFSTSRFAIRFLNPVHNAAEDRYLEERILTPLDGSPAALQAIVRRLRANRVVSLTAHRGVGRYVEAPFLEGTLKVAPGAPILAHTTGAALVPVFPVRAADGAIDVTLGPIIDLPAGVPRGEAVEAAVRTYARTLEPFVLRDPAQWLGWVHLQ
jgi:lauroyl/myristoyl acyltransferase